MTGTTDGHPAGARHPRRGLSVRIRITVTVAVLVTVALAGSGAIVYLVENRAILADTQREVEQELDEFAALQATDNFGSIAELLEGFLKRNVPDDDELLVGWVGDGPRFQFPTDPLVADPAFRSLAPGLATNGGTRYLSTDRGEVRITSQPVRQGQETGALFVITYLAEDQGEVARTMRTYAIVALVLAMMSTAVAAWQSGRLLRPLRSLRLAAERISATDLDGRLPVHGNDDISALTHTFNTMLDRLERSFAVQRQFLDDAGHELRTPLTILGGHLELVDLDDPADVAATRTLLLEEIDRMARLVRDLTLLAKSDRPDFLTLGGTDPSALVAAVLSKARGLGERDWVLSVPDATAPDAIPDELILDGQRITQALLAFADNAVKHTGAGDRIEIGAALSGTMLQLWCHDSGAGVAAEDADHIFGRFGRAHVPADDEGFGLGLSIVSAIAHAHGGSAYVDAHGSPGARFVIEIPAVQPVSTDPDAYPDDAEEA